MTSQTTEIKDFHSAQVLSPPTTCLPPISTLHEHSIAELQKWVNYLRILYNPEVRGSRRRTAKFQNDAFISFGHSQNHEQLPNNLKLDEIRSDSFERAHAVRWLTALVSRTECLSDNIEFLSAIEDNVNNAKSVLEQLIDSAASLLAICAGASASGKLTRLFTFGSLPDGEVSIQLTDAPLESQDFSSVGAQTWGGACVMADQITSAPGDFLDTSVKPLSCASSSNDVIDTGYRILELGAGTGLVGLTVAKLLQLRKCRAEVVLSDFHPIVLDNLRINVESNFPSSAYSDISVKVCLLDWESFPLDTATEHTSLYLKNPFDLIFGADIIYEQDHAKWIKSCLEKLLRRPGSPDSPNCNQPAFFHLLIPLRRTHKSESITIEQVFPRADDIDISSASSEANLGDLDLAILHVEKFVCDALSDSYVEEVEYAYYKIGWHSYNL